MTASRLYIKLTVVVSLSLTIIAYAGLFSKHKCNEEKPEFGGTDRHNFRVHTTKTPTVTWNNFTTKTTCYANAEFTQHPPIRDGVCLYNIGSPVYMKKEINFAPRDLKYY